MNSYRFWIMQQQKSTEFQTCQNTWHFAVMMHFLSSYEIKLVTMPFFLCKWHQNLYSDKHTAKILTWTTLSECISLVAGWISKMKSCEYWLLFSILQAETLVNRIRFAALWDRYRSCLWMILSVASFPPQTNIESVSYHLLDPLNVDNPIC